MALQLGEEIGNGLAFDQLTGLVEVIVDDGLGVDAGGVVDGGEEVGRMDRILSGGRAGGIGCPVNVSALDAGAADDGGVAVGPVIATIGTVGASSAPVSAVYLCGTQALGAAWAMQTKTTVRKEDDYGFKYGVGFMEMRGVEKVLYGQGTSGKQWGMVTGYVAD